MAEASVTFLGRTYQPAPVGRARLPWRPHWLGSPCADGVEAIAAWKEFARTSSSAIHLLPEIALLPRQNIAQPFVHAVWDDKGAMRSVAVLTAAEHHIPLLPGFHMALRARRLIDESIAGENTRATADAFVDSAAGILQRGECDCVLAEAVEEPSPLRDAMWQAPHRYSVVCIAPVAPSPHRYIRFPASPPTYWSQFSKKSRYNFRWRAKHLEHSVLCVQSPADVPMFVDRVCALMRQTWQHKRLGVVYHPEIKLELWGELARLGALRSYLLQHHDRTIAFAIGYQWHGTYVYQETGYDPEYSARSPGQVLLYRVIEDLIARDTPSLFDFGYGDNEYKRIFANHQTLTGSMMLVRKSIRPMIAVRAGQVHAGVGRVARAGLARMGALSILRHVHRGRRSAAAKDMDSEA